ncbi:Putative cell wall binding repeat-containing protein [Ruminococcaceae bacterium YRB3002]|nr:Putative cell wall binding repeat-containing protein [Ruminococcaceae bacterium YRB3002]
MIKFTAFVLAVVMGCSSLCFADESDVRPEGAVDISEEEIAYIEGELENGRTTEEIAIDLANNAAVSFTSYSSVTWVKKSGKWYCKDSSGIYIKGFAKISGAVYYMNSSGVMLTGWQQISGTWYYFASSGAMKTGWQKISKKWYYFNSNGEMLTGLQSIGGSYYIFNSSGAMATGWKQYENKWYYLNSSGAAKVSTWFKSGSTWYYFGSDGVMATGSVSIGGKYYLFNGSGAMLTGWQKYNGEWYYLASSGAAYTGWIVYGGQKYFLDVKGMMLHDTEVGEYELDSEGHIITRPEPDPEEPDPTGYFKTDAEDEAVTLINNIRKAEAVSIKKEYYVPVVMDSTARDRAHTRCKEIVSNFSHTSASGNSMGSECIYEGDGNKSASQIVTAWKNSTTHYNLLNTGLTKSTCASHNCGIGIYVEGGKTYAVFGTRGANTGTPPASGYVAPTATPNSYTSDEDYISQDNIS